ncbi:MAG: phosphoribosylamine--glycine ligase [Treponema sp.]|jgi:phosphoribosylamine--glycine ligase|nr:phosphoribosylamine--glycine ligase [Treponema sp.]
MKLLVIGSGGREHAIAWKLAQSPVVERIYVAPGNGGTSREAKCANVPLPGPPESPEGRAALLEFAQKERIYFTVVGPEAPLAEGIVDRFREADLFILGPGREAARLETSKVRAKSFIEKYGIRTARSHTFSDYYAALHYAENYFKSNAGTREQDQEFFVRKPSSASAHIPPLVIKADGLASGKGVAVADSLEEAERTLRSFIKEGSLGEAGKTVLLEEFINGKEVSVLAAVSVRPGRKGTILPFIPARDHKRRFDGDKGPNTGGMGAIAPVPDFSAAARVDFTAKILKPTLSGLEQEGLDYRGFIFFGLMVKDDHCYLLEYNVRLGDPETQAVLPLMETDMTDLCTAVLRNNLEAFPLTWKSGVVCAPVAVADGYPGPYRKGDSIIIDEARLNQSEGRIFFAGTSAAGDGPLVTSGGRVLAASAWGADLEIARTKAYAALHSITFPGMGCRRDIGAV